LLEVSRAVVAVRVATIAGLLLEVEGGEDFSILVIVATIAAKPATTLTIASCTLAEAEEEVAAAVEGLAHGPDRVEDDDRTREADPVPRAEEDHHTVEADQGRVAAGGDRTVAADRDPRDDDDQTPDQEAGQGHAVEAGPDLRQDPEAVRDPDPEVGQRVDRGPVPRITHLQ